MNNTVVLKGLVSFILFVLMCVSNQTMAQNDVPYYAKKIIAAYPDFQLSYKDNAIVFPDGTRIVYDDKKKKSFVEKLDDSDIEDMFSMVYDVKAQAPTYLNDCGRSRNETLFKKMYGKSESEVRKNLVPVEWFGQKILFDHWGRYSLITC